MAAAVFTERDTGVAEAEFDIELGIAYAVPDLVIIAAREYSECGAERNQAHGTDACGHIHHVGFGDSAVIETFRECFFEGTGHRCGSQVGIQDHDPVIFFAQLDQGFTICGTNCFLFHVFSPPNLSKPERPVQRSVLFRASRPGLP